MKKIIITISLIFVVVFIFSIPCFAYDTWSPVSDNYINNVDFFNIGLNDVSSSRPLDNSNTYDVTYTCYLLSAYSDINLSDITVYNDFPNSTSVLSLSKLGSYPISRFNQFYVFLPSLSLTSLPDLISSSLNLYKFSFKVSDVPYQSCISIDFWGDDLKRSLFGTYYDSSYKSSLSILKYFEVAGNKQAYLIPLLAHYDFNSLIEIPNFYDSNYEYNVDIVNDYFYMGYMPSIFTYFYGGYDDYSYKTFKRTPYAYQFNISSSSLSYNYFIYNCGFGHEEELYIEMSPFYKDIKNKSYQYGVLKSVDLSFVNYTSSTSLDNFIKTLNGHSVFVLPSHVSTLPEVTHFAFYDYIYKTTSSQLNNYVISDFTNGNININYSQYYLQKEHWYDFGKDLYNCLIFLIFNIPLLNNVTAPLFMLLNNFIGVWSTLILPLTTLGVVGAFFLFCFIYKTIKKLIGG